MLARIRKAEQSDKGFTLIELLVVVIIIGILSAIAIPTFLKQREKAWDKALSSDLRNNALKMEEHLDDKGAYPVAATTFVPTGADAAYAFKASETNNPTAILSANASGFCLSVTSTKDFTAKVKVFNSATGRPVLPATTGACTAATYPAAAAAPAA